ncbi:BMP-binding endothelial regulator protein isoform X1 [Nasonia vitripennis]|uniref:Crossveinless 2 n=2 Tax=Nasonia vitripennis TaxID=7425 RepID=A0A7M7PXN9_NASVI|nr:BMP-binding endothelial regulator protein isoform X1 [Nasonia vitripennis]
MQEKSLTRISRLSSSDINSMQTFVLLSSTTLSFAIGLYVFFSVAQRSSSVTAQLSGSVETCDAEGEPILSPGIPDIKCFHCTCKSGMVQCVKQNCSKIEGCYVLQELRNDECCRKCKGCMKNGLYHESGTEWTEPNKPCKSLTCIAGVITESSIRCRTPCSNPVPPALGQCCPTCPNCRFKGKTISKETSIMPKHDPCTLCDCTSGKLACAKKACPVLNCPESQIVHSFEDCCPRCQGSGTYVDPPRQGACLLQGLKLHKSGTQFTLDDCTHCSCENSTVFCQRESCPILSCKREQQTTWPGQCCPQCIGSDNGLNIIETDQAKDKTQEVEKLNSCAHSDTIYKDGATWNTETCETCTCQAGKIKCLAMTCPAIRCPQHSILAIPEGECCPLCEERESKGVCRVFGGSHVRTFDGKLYAFVGSCKYQLASDCDGGTFNIRLKNTVVGNDVTIKRVSLRLGKIKVDLQQNKNSKVNDRIVDLPYRKQDKLEVKEFSGNIVVRSEIGIKVLWNYMGFVEVTIPKSYRKTVCGLCGGFDSITDNDLTTREGILVDDPATFAQSWTSGEDICLDTRNYGMRGCNPRKDQRLCSYIKGSAFEKCLNKINVTSYYEACLKDVCECPPNDLQCHCQSFSTYVRDCQRLGILLPRWRRSVGC